MTGDHVNVDMCRVASAGYLYHGRVDERPLEGADATCFAQTPQLHNLHVFTIQAASSVMTLSLENGTFGMNLVRHSRCSRVASSNGAGIQVSAQLSPTLRREGFIVILALLAANY